MRGGDLDATRAEFHVNIVISNDRYAPVRQGQNNLLADQVLVALIVGVHGNGRIAQHGFGSGGRDHQVFFRVVGQRVAEMPEVTGFFFRHHLKIRNGGLQLRIPVDEALAAIDQAFIVESDKDFENSARQALVHRESFSFPVQ